MKQHFSSEANTMNSFHFKHSHINPKNIRVNLIRPNTRPPPVVSYHSTSKDLNLNPNLNHTRQNSLSRLRDPRKRKTQTNIKVKPILAPLIGHYFVAKGNNHSLVVSVLELKGYQFSPRPLNAKMVWLQDNSRYEYSSKKSTTLVNMFQCHQELTDKDKLYTNMRSFCLDRDMDINTIMPISFVVDLSSPNSKAMLSQFLKYYLNSCQQSSKHKQKTEFNISHKRFPLKIRYKSLVATGKQETQQNPKTGKEPPIWILKPSNLNRGRGIKLFSKLKTLEDQLKQDGTFLAFGMYRKKPQSPQTKYVIQKYISNPLFINKRKFDIRVWVLIDTNFHSYFFKEGYLRLSGYEYSLTKEELSNLYIHLTNNAIQKNSPVYGAHQQGNQLSFRDLETYLSNNTSIDYPKLIQRIKEIVKMTLEATLPLMNPKRWKNCFQLLGYDFLVDQLGQVWLIECNTNPCLQESSQLLSALIPKLLRESMSILRDNSDSCPYFQRLI